jgi:hypothetical protein
MPGDNSPLKASINKVVAGGVGETGEIRSNYFARRLR